MSDPGPIRILLVDDHLLFRKAIASLFETQPGYEVVGEAGDGEAALDLAVALRPDVILMDITMPGMSGLEATRRITAALPDARIVMLTMVEADDSLFAAIRSGARGYLEKGAEPRTFFRTVTAVAEGELGLSHAMAAKVVSEFARQGEQPPAPAGSAVSLSPREREVLKLVAQGKSNQEIADALGVAHNTVKNHLRHLLEKLQVENRVQAAAFAVRLHLLEDGSLKRDPA
jgi:DNA-binding NarL/FixJ family response regulator